MKLTIDERYLTKYKQNHLIESCFQYSIETPGAAASALSHFKKEISINNF